MHMTARHLAIGVLIFSSFSATGVHAQERRQQLDLNGAIELALRSNPSLQATQSQIALAEGKVAAASRDLQHNPELSLMVGPRSPSDPAGSRSTDLEIELEQVFATGGPRQHRVAAAESGVGVASALAADRRRIVELETTLRFYRAVAADRLAEVAEGSEALAAELVSTAERRLRLGEGTQLEVNAARIRHGRARRRVSEALAGQRTATIRVLEVVALPLDTDLRVLGEFPDPITIESEHVLANLSARPDLVSITAAIQAAEAEVQLADSEAKPELAARASYSREEGDQIVMAGLRLELPFFHRNQGELLSARAQVQVLQSERRAAERAAKAEVLAALAIYEQAVAALQVYDESLLSVQEDSLRLLRRAFEEGEAGYPEVLVLQQEVVISREEFVGAQLFAAQSLARLRASAALPQNTRGGV